MSPHSIAASFELPAKAPMYRKDSNASPVILIRQLARTLDSNALKSMLVFAKDLISVDFVPNPSDDQDFRTAVARFATSIAAQEVKSMLDGKWNSNGDAHLIVSYVPISPGGTPGLRRFLEPTSSDGIGHVRTSKFNGSFSTFDQITPTLPTSGFASVEGASRSESYSSIFPQAQQIGSPLERQRISGKSMISEDNNADDETGKLINDPIAFAKNDMAQNNQARRSTLPQLPINRLANLSISSPANSPSMNGLTSPRSIQSPASFTSNHGMPTPALSNGFQNSNLQYPRNTMPPVNPADQNPPCNTLYVGNLPQDTAEDELKLLFSKQRGYKRLCFRVKQQGPMCFVEFEDVSFATKALHELYGHMLSNSIKGGIRLSFSKNPLGVRANQQNALASPSSPQGGLNGMNGMGYGNMAAFAAASGPPPGLSMPSPYATMSSVHGGTYGAFSPSLSNGNFHGPISPTITSTLSGRSPNPMTGTGWGSVYGDHQYGRPLYG